MKKIYEYIQMKNYNKGLQEVKLILEKSETDCILVFGVFTILISMRNGVF